MSERSGEELELKYAVDDLDALADWLDEHFPPPPRSRSAADGWRTVDLTDRYFDTPGGALARSGHAGRLRTYGRRTLVGLKADIDVRGAVHHRLEVEAPARASLRPADWPASPVRERVLELSGGQRLVERFVIGQRRRERRYRPGGALVVFSLDDAEVLLAGQRVGALRQLEVELLEGSRSDLLGIARRLRASGLLRPERRGKMVIAARLAAAHAAVQPTDSWAVAGRKILRLHVLRMIEREAAVRAGDVQALKQMRVATRRLRATWRLFGGAFRRAERRRFSDALRELGSRLGAVRDLDVLLAGLPGKGASRPLADAWRARRAVAYADLLAHLDSAAYRRFVDELLALTDGRGRPARRGRPRKSVAQRAPAALRAAHARVVRAAETGSDPPTEEQLHALRIECRRLRYTIEALRGLMPRQRAARLLARLVRVQDHLGALNDAVVAARAIGEWLDDAGTAAPAATRNAVEAWRARRLAAADALRQAFPMRWRSVSERTFGRMLETALPES